MDSDYNKKLTIYGLIAAILVGSMIYVYNHFLVPEKPDMLLNKSGTVSTFRNTTTEVVAHISGAVKNEGVYKLSNGGRIYDAVNASGGTLLSADYSQINLAEAVKDGQKIVIPFKDNETKRKTAEVKSNGKKISINRASTEDLDTLPGVGPKTAKMIISARPFLKIEDLINIPRFGKSKFDKIKGQITL